MNYFAHSENSVGRREPLRHHLEAVSQHAASLATSFGAADEARVIGLLHDLGKYGDLFVKRLQGREHGIDHWSAGAWEALVRYRLNGVAAALAIQGHHIGLQKAGCDNDLHDINPEKAAPNRRASHPNHAELLERLTIDGVALPPLTDSLFDYKRRYDQFAAAMLDVRMLFSTLVDADFLETEAHFTAVRRDPPPSLNPGVALEMLLRHIQHLAQNANANPDVQNMRADLLDACRRAGRREQGLFTLTAPTGTGKTLSMLAFALEHALKHELRRVVMVIPYLSIIEQTTRVLRDVFRDMPDPNRYILEHHSMTGIRNDGLRGSVITDEDNSNEALREARHLAENWDAPLVVTTSVQFLESLFANRPAACRKLHNLSQSVVLFDEVQTLPVHLAVPTLATLSHLAAHYGATVVFSTATQPAFSHLDEAVKAYAPSGWKPTEIVPPELGLYVRAKRTQVEWRHENDRLSWHEVAQEILTHKQALCIVNMRAHATELFTTLSNLVTGTGAPALYHLSTLMCPAHRSKVLEEVRERLKNGYRCVLIATQCIEAGVDVDFPVVYRAFGPLDAIAQAAGRCNRNGNLPVGRVIVFVPQTEDGKRLYPDASYRQAASVAKSLGPHPDIHDPGVFTRYYRNLFSTVGVADQDGAYEESLINAIKRLDFVDTAERYRLIPDDSVNILVPFDTTRYRELADKVRQTGLTAAWIREARPHTIAFFRPSRNTPLVQFLEPLRIRGEKTDDWYIDTRIDDGYDPSTGFLIPREWQFMV